MPLAHCSIGTSTDRIDLLDLTGIHLDLDWTPVAGSVDAEVSSSPLADYSRVRYYREVVTEETLPFTVKKSSQDDVIRAIQNLRRMCRAAMDYWVEKWNNDPVYLAVQASCETNRRYAIIHSGGVPEDNNPFGQPFLQQGDRAVMVQQLILVRGPWTETAPGVATCIEACAPDSYACWPSYLEFDGVGDYVNAHSDANLDDLPPGGITVEAWVRADGWGQNNWGHIAQKWDGAVAGVGWQFYITSAGGLTARINQAVADAGSTSGPDEFTIDGLWHHVAMTYHPTGYSHNGYIRLWIDGTEVQTYTAYVQGVGAYATDAALELGIGNRLAGGSNLSWDGAIGWVRVHSWPIYRRDFTPQPRCEIPGAWYTAAGTSVTEGIWIYEGTGATTGNQAGLTAGTISGATWACDCVRSPGRLCDPEDGCAPSYLNFDGVADSGKVSISGAGDLDNMVDDGLDFTAEVWVRANGWGASGFGQIFNKQADPNYGNLQPGWYLETQAANGVFFYIYGNAGGSGYAGSGPDEFSADGLWHHIVAAKDATGGTNATLYLAVDGVWVSSYSTRWNKTGAYGTDAADPLVIGNRHDYARTFDGDIAWCRFSDHLRYTPGVNFTPPDRCTLPIGTGIANVYGIFVWEGIGTQLYDWSGNCDPGYILGAADWGCDCTIDAEALTSCESPAWIANLLKTSTLTNIYHYYDDAAGNDYWSGNLLDAPLPYPLLSPTGCLLLPAASADGLGPILYIGVDDTLLNRGLFNNVVFDLAQTTGLNGQWEFYSDLGGAPAWRPMATYLMGPQDNTNNDGLMTFQPFTTLGVKSVHWQQHPYTGAPGPPFISWQVEWLDTAVAGVGAPHVYGYWIRYKGTAGSSVPPIQQNRHPYTIAVPYIEINDEDVPGDIAASMALKLYNEADHDGGTNEPILYTSRLICGLRSLARGEDFVAYLNISETGNPAFINFSVDAAWAMAFDETAPTSYLAYRAVPASTTTDAGELVISDGYTNQFYGEYRAFLRANTAGVGGDISLQLELTFGYGRGSSAISDWVDSQWPGGIELFDMGSFTIPPTEWILQSEDTPLGIAIRARNNDAGAAHDVSLYDVILIPVDEWAGDFTGSPTSYVDILSGNRSMAVDAWGGLGRYFYADSITYPKFDLRAVSLIRDTDNFTGRVDPVANRPAVLQENANQRLWFLSELHEGPVADRHADIEICHSVEVFRQANYLSMRGDR